ncbi:uncharacterized protein [Coffea arabica]|uniref:Uncharacterized protein n=1 Tax=Coffea arabica TaxID=13443 RepID=A0A6P6SB81_COFAR|nr:uncharacterized protein LOC113689531 [Coffea arabica]
MAAEEILKLFDSYWFEHGIFTSKHCLASSTSKPIHDQEEHELEKSKLASIVNLQVRSLSDHCVSYDTGFSPNAASPKSAISTPTLPKILSGVEVSDFSERIEEQEKIETTTTKKFSNRRRRSRGISRSLSELEYEELKGFMDLGFVFTEEDKSSSLASIIPGLQRWGKQGSNELVHDKYAVSRPYLSEAWGVLNQRKVNKLPVRWRFPDVDNEINMKDQLKAWAQTVASTVR